MQQSTNEVVSLMNARQNRLDEVRESFSRHSKGLSSRVFFLLFFLSFVVDNCSDDGYSDDSCSDGRCLDDSCLDDSFG